MIVLTPYQQKRLALLLEFVDGPGRITLAFRHKPGRQLGTLIVECPTSGQRWEVGPGQGAR